MGTFLSSPQGDILTESRQILLWSLTKTEPVCRLFYTKRGNPCLFN